MLSAVRAALASPLLVNGWGATWAGRRRRMWQRLKATNAWSCCTQGRLHTSRVGDVQHAARSLNKKRVQPGPRDLAETNLWAPSRLLSEAHAGGILDDPPIGLRTPTPPSTLKSTSPKLAPQQHTGRQALDRRWTDPRPTRMGRIQLLQAAHDPRLQQNANGAEGRGPHHRIPHRTSAHGCAPKCLASAQIGCAYRGASRATTRANVAADREHLRRSGDEPDLTNAAFDIASSAPPGPRMCLGLTRSRRAAPMGPMFVHIRANGGQFAMH